MCWWYLCEPVIDSESTCLAAKEAPPQRSYEGGRGGDRGDRGDRGERSGERGGFRGRGGYRREGAPPAGGGTLSALLLLYIFY